VTTVALLGAGVMASALTAPLADNGHDVRLVGTHLDRAIVDAVRGGLAHPDLGRPLPEPVRAYQLEDAGAAFEGAEVVVSGVSSPGVRWAGERLAGLLVPGQAVLAVAKGMEAGRGGELRNLVDVLAGQVPAELRGRVGWAGVAGPSIAGEVAARRDTCVVFAGRDQAVLERLAGTFRTGWYRVSTSGDLVGVEVCAAMKNCYALGVGLAAGLLGPDPAHDAEAALFAQGLVEMGRMVRALGGRPETVTGLAGAGDLYVTSKSGRNLRAGALLGAGQRLPEALEGLGTVESVAALRVIGGALPELATRGVVGAGDFPLLAHLHALVAGEGSAAAPWAAFFDGR
jgi:glycerol-3-phosphate dehydrogenase (NAD(P)+)